MRVMVDTNILFSAIIFPKGQAAKAFTHCLLNHELVISTYVINELKQVIKKKKPEKLSAIDDFFEKLSFELAYTSDNIETELFSIRDPKNVDILISGDKDFKDTDVTHPEILTPQEFLEKY